MPRFSSAGLRTSEERWCPIGCKNDELIPVLHVNLKFSENGQNLNVLMAVVIQEMISDGIAGCSGHF